MRGRIGVLLLLVVGVGAMPGVNAHWTCEDEATASDPTGTLHFRDVEGETWVYTEKNTFPGLQPHACFDANDQFYPQDQFVYKL